MPDPTEAHRATRAVCPTRQKLMLIERSKELPSIQHIDPLASTITMM